MLIKKAYQGEFKHLLSILRLAVLDNRSYVAFSKKKFNYLALLSYLKTAGFIESYEQRKEIVVIGLKQTYWKSFQQPIHPFSTIESVRVGKRGILSSKAVSRQVFRQGQVPHLAISTDQGLMGAREAGAKKLGGIPLFKIY